MFSYVTNDARWAEAPMGVWVFVGTVIMLATVWRFGWGGAQIRLAKYRVSWGVSLALAVVASASLYTISGQRPHYLYL